MTGETHTFDDPWAKPAEPVDLSYLESIGRKLADAVKAAETGAGGWHRVAALIDDVARELDRQTVLCGLAEQPQLSRAAALLPLLHISKTSPQFADPGGNSALHAASRSNPRDLPCPTCGEPDRLTREDRAQGYQCDACADRSEMGY